jgi:hypothetical protein
VKYAGLIVREGISMLYSDEPVGWRELCAKLRAETNREKFEIIVDQINRLLTAAEKSHSGQGFENHEDRAAQSAKLFPSCRGRKLTRTSRHALVTLIRAHVA